MRSSREQLFAFISKDGRGVEIGPGPRPLAPKKQGYNVQVIDYIDQAQLVEKFSPEGSIVDSIEPVDFVWNGETYSELTGNKNYYDWVIASHVIEHTPDLISFLKNCEDILKKDGYLVLIIPDKRFCFDRSRSTSSLSKVIDCYLERKIENSPGSVVEFLQNHSTSDGNITWHAGKQGTLSPTYAYPQIEAYIQTIGQPGEYIDIHNWCFTPNYFRLLIHDLQQLHFVSFREHFFATDDSFEFYIVLQKSSHPPKMSRTGLLALAQRDLYEEGTIPLKTFMQSQWRHGSGRLKRAVRRLIK